MNSSHLSRRTFLSRSVVGSIAAGAALASLEKRLFAADAAALKGRIHHSVCKWCYPKISLEDLCAAGKEMGLTSVELVHACGFPDVEEARADLRDGQQSDGRKARTAKISAASSARSIARNIMICWLSL